MAGRPKRRAMIEELERLTREYFDEDLTSTHLDYAVAQIESGVPIAGIARKLADGTGLEIQRQVLSGYLHSLSDDAFNRLAEARPKMAHAMTEEALSIVDAPMYDKIDVARAALRARTRENVAKMLNPEFQQPKAGLTLNVGSLHLAALAPGLAAHTRVSLMPTDALVAPVAVSNGASDNEQQTA